MDIDLEFEIKAAIPQYENVKNIIKEQSTIINVEEEFIFETTPINI